MAGNTKLETGISKRRAGVARGLDGRAYHVVDYVDGKDFGIVRGPVAHLSTDFSKDLLLEATSQ